MSQKIYANNKEKQKAYTERKKRQGFTKILITVPKHLTLFVKGNPSKLADAFMSLYKDLYIEFNSLVFTTEGEIPYAMLSNDDGVEWRVTHPDQIKTLERFKGKIRLYTDGTIKVVKS